MGVRQPWIDPVPDPDPVQSLIHRHIQHKLRFAIRPLHQQRVNGIDATQAKMNNRVDGRNVAPVDGMVVVLQLAGAVFNPQFGTQCQGILNVPLQLDLKVMIERIQILLPLYKVFS